MTNRFRVKVYGDFFDEEPLVNRVVSAGDHAAAAAVVLRDLNGVAWADWIRVEQQGRCPSVMCFLDSRLVGGSLEYETFFRR